MTIILAELNPAALLFALFVAAVIAYLVGMYSGLIRRAAPEPKTADGSSAAEPSCPQGMTTQTSTILIVCAVLLGAGLIVGQREMEKAQVRAVLEQRQSDKRLMETIDLLVYSCQQDEQAVDAEFLADNLRLYGGMMDTWLRKNPPVTHKGQALATLRGAIGAAAQEVQKDPKAASAIKARLLPEIAYFQGVTKDGLR